MTKKKEVVEVVQDAEKPVKREILAESIVRIGEAMKKLLESGLNERAIIVLIHDTVPNPGYGRTKISRGEIGQVFDALRVLKARYCR